MNNILAHILKSELPYYNANEKKCQECNLLIADCDICILKEDK